jgi:fatty acid desaturase
VTISPTLLASFLAIAGGILIRQIDRMWYSARRQGIRFTRRERIASVRALFSIQAERSNNVTPVLLVIGHWLELAGWWLLLTSPVNVSWLVTCLMVGVKLRHLQETTHFAAHGILAKNKKLGYILAELAFQSPACMLSIEKRRQQHVVEHHPNATRDGLDPNLVELANSGLRPGCSRLELIRGLMHPVTLTGLLNTMVGFAHSFRTAKLTRLHNNIFLLLLLPGASYLLAGIDGLVFGYIIPRTVVYPMLAWASVLVEHNYFIGKISPGRPYDVERQRCVRLYPSNKVLELISRASWLPFGDLFHFAHSVFPRLRWNYLPRADLFLGSPALACSAILAAADSLVQQVYVTPLIHRSSNEALRQCTGK